MCFVIFMVTYLYAVALTQSRGGLRRGHSPWSEPSSSEAPSEAASRHPSWRSPRLCSATPALRTELVPRAVRDVEHGATRAPPTELADRHRDRQGSSTRRRRLVELRGRSRPVLLDLLDLPGATKLRHSRVLSHNTYLELLSELGVVGRLFTAVLVATFVPAVVALHGLRSSVAASTLAGRGFVVGRSGSPRLRLRIGDQRQASLALARRDRGSPHCRGGACSRDQPDIARRPGAGPSARR